MTRKVPHSQGRCEILTPAVLHSSPPFHDPHPPPHTHTPHAANLQYIMAATASPVLALVGGVTPVGVASPPATPATPATAAAAAAAAAAEAAVDAAVGAEATEAPGSPVDDASGVVLTSLPAAVAPVVPLAGCWADRTASGGAGV